MPTTTPMAPRRVITGGLGVDTRKGQKRGEVGVDWGEPGGILSSTEEVPISPADSETPTMSSFEMLPTPTRGNSSRWRRGKMKVEAVGDGGRRSPFSTVRRKMRLVQEVATRERAAYGRLVHNKTMRFSGDDQEEGEEGGDSGEEEEEGEEDWGWVYSGGRDPKVVWGEKGVEGLKERVLRGMSRRGMEKEGVKEGAKVGGEGKQGRKRWASFVERMIGWLGKGKGGEEVEGDEDYEEEGEYHYDTYPISGGHPHSTPINTINSSADSPKRNQHGQNISTSMQKPHHCHNASIFTHNRCHTSMVLFTPSLFAPSHPQPAETTPSSPPEFSPGSLGELRHTYCIHSDYDLQARPPPFFQPSPLNNVQMGYFEGLWSATTADMAVHSGVGKGKGEWEGEYVYDSESSEMRTIRHGNLNGPRKDKAMV